MKLKDALCMISYDASVYVHRNDWQAETFNSIDDTLGKSKWLDRKVSTISIKFNGWEITIIVEVM